MARRLGTGLLREAMKARPDAGRIMRPYDGKTTAEVHDYVDEQTPVLASSLAKRAPGYVSLGFPDPRRLPYTPNEPPSGEGETPVRSEG